MPENSINKNESLDLINSLIKDYSNKSKISDGVLTLGELHSDRMSLFVLSISMLSKLYSLKKEEVLVWYSPHKTEGYYHVGLEAKDITLGGVFPKLILKALVKEINPQELKTPKQYKSIYEELELFNTNNKQ